MRFGQVSRVATHRLLLRVLIAKQAYLENVFFSYINSNTVTLFIYGDWFNEWYIGMACGIGPLSGRMS